MKPPRPCPGCGLTTHKDCRPPSKVAPEYRRPEYIKLRREVREGMWGPCAVCGSWNDLTVGHRVPTINGGCIEDGWRVECRPCNGKAGGGIRRG